jgi:FkbM family methyltransferase
MLQAVKNRIRSLAERVGIEIRRSSVYSSQRLRYQKLFSTLDVDLVIDVGANAGQFGQLCRLAGYTGEIISFEAAGLAHAELEKTAVGDQRWSVAERMALGAANGEVEINIAANSYSSSLLQMLDSHLNAAPESKYVRTEKVQMKRLDDAIGSSAGVRRIFLKMDVQGYEAQVLCGASGLLPQTVAVQMEMSLIPLYQGETLIMGMCAEMARLGFTIWDFDPVFRNSTTGRLLEVDGIFVCEGVTTAPQLDES